MNFSKTKFIILSMLIIIMCIYMTSSVAYGIDNTTAIGIIETVNDAADEQIEIKNRNLIVERAQSHIGCPYSWGGTTSEGFDCSGFVSYCLCGEEGVRLGTTATIADWPIVEDPQPGDICITYGHCGVYVGDGRMIHASTYEVGVIESEVQSGMFYVRWPDGNL